MFDKLHEAIDGLENAYWRIRYFFGYKSRWHDLADVIYNLEPTDTPFLTALEKEAEATEAAPAR